MLWDPVYAEVRDRCGPRGDEKPAGGSPSWRDAGLGPSSAGRARLASLEQVPHAWHFWEGCPQRAEAPPGPEQG